MKYKMSGMGCRVLCVVKAESADDAFAKARHLFGNIITGCQPWDDRYDSDKNRDWIMIQ